MYVLRCQHCGAFHVIFNGAPASFICRCGGRMEEFESLSEAFGVELPGAAVSAEAP